MTKQIVWTILLIWLLSVTALSQIISPEKLFGKYQQFVWQDQHGLPQNGISEIVQTPDGYLWLAIAEGVARFDGVRFTAFNTENTPEIKSNNVQALLVDHNGTLWIGTHGGGLSRYKDGKFANFSTPEGLSAPFVRAIFEDHSGNIWIGTDGGGLNLFRDGRFTVYSTAEGLPDTHITTINEDAKGNLLVGTRKGLVQFQDGKFSVFTEKADLDKKNIEKIFRDKSDNLWVSGNNGLSHINGWELTSFGEDDGLKNSLILSINQDLDGNLWFGTKDNGLYRFKDNHFEPLTSEQGLITDGIQAIFPDQLGNIWLGTNGGGLAELKTGRFRTYTTADGLVGNIILAIFEDRAGGVWLGTDQGLSRFFDGKFTSITSTDGEKFAHTNTLTQDHEGNIWSRSNAGVNALKFRETDSKVDIVQAGAFANRASAILQDKTGNIWYGTSYNGLHRVGLDGWETEFHKKDGLADEYINALFEDSKGNLWVGTRNGLSRFKDGIFTTFTASSGWTGNHVLSFHEDGDGNIWIGTHGDGLFLFQNGKFSVVNSKNGLYDNLAFQILEDDNQNLWMSGNRGIYRANIGEIEDFVAGRRSSVNSFAYGSYDGMLSRECNGSNPAGIRTKDGRLWFPTIKGAVVIDPKITDEKQPTVKIEQILIDNQVLANGMEVKMQPTQNDLEIQFTALSWNRPSQIKFKYQLVGLDNDWVDAGTRRTAYYPHIAPGDYTFRVIADNGEGVWNNEGQSIPVKVLPPFYRTWWFYGLSALVIALIIRLIYNYRLAQLKKINEAKTLFTQQLIENQEQERKRIAVELHDAIGQSLIVIRNRALMGLNTPEKQDRLIAQMEEISEAAADSITEVRRISQNLHPYQIEHLGLTTAIETMIENAANASPIEFEKDIDDVDGILSKEAEINLYRIVQESINNILKHSEATKAKISIHRNSDLLSVLIKDNGKGFSPENLPKRKSGLGLTGIFERAKMLGAKHEISSFQGDGTIVSLQLNLSEKV
ncbi:MAG: hypothetical protein K1X72_08805 [Pyrinomonadaceae bacterium]|nr:hypothetical protein [Pyrinomonadaceae bacterium]